MHTQNPTNKQKNPNNLPLCQKNNQPTNQNQPTKNPKTHSKSRGNSNACLEKAQTQNLNAWEAKALSRRTQNQEITDSLFLKLQTVFLDSQDQKLSQSHSYWDMYSDAHPSSHWSLCLWRVLLSFTLTNCARIHCSSNKCCQIF